MPLMGKCLLLRRLSADADRCNEDGILYVEIWSVILKVQSPRLIGICHVFVECMHYAEV